ncbi:MAG TPA: type IV pilus secretin PilQ, partial [Candidatus Binatia bacterium]|nr:type IV pilus secretin PilQ [Candidatus Binatia bacterium]
AAGVLLLAAVCLGLFGCSATPGKPAVVSTPSSEAPPKAAPSQVAPKSPLLEPQAFNLQDLSVREERGQTTVWIKFSQPVVEFRHFPLPQPTRIVLDIFGDTKQSSQTETFRIDTNWLSMLRFSSLTGSLRLTFDIAAATVPPYTISPEDGGLKIVVGSVEPNATARKDLTLVKRGKRTDATAVDTASVANGDMKRSISEPVPTEKKYTGQKISLDFKDADIKNVFRLLAEVSGLNIVVTNDVNQKVTIRLVEVPWDQALDLLIETNGLGKEQLNNVVRISTAGTLKSEKDALIAAQKSKQDLEPLQTVYFNVNYAKVKDLEPKVKTLLSKRPDAALVTDERSNTIMVRDIKKSVDDVATLVTKLDLRTPQVLIESNLIETTPSFARSLGAELNFTLSTPADFDSRFLAGAPFVGSLTPTIPPTVIPLPGPGFRLGIFQNRFGPFKDLNYVLTAAENEGNVKIISRPSVVTLNNVASTIKNERILRIALPSSTNIASGSGAAAGTAVATEKIPVGITLNVIPQVSSDGFVLMNINVKSSSIADNPTVSTGTSGVIPFDELNREAIANVLVRDGETIVIGGILKDTDATSESGVPYLKNIPVLGWLFKNMRWQKNFEELVVFITPRIASAGSENLPTADQLWREQMRKTEGKQSAPATTPATP